MTVPRPPDQQHVVPVDEHRDLDMTPDEAQLAYEAAVERLRVAEQAMADRSGSEPQVS